MLDFCFHVVYAYFAWKCVFMRGNPDFIRPSFARIGNMPNGDRPSGAKGEEGRLAVRATLRRREPRPGIGRGRGAATRTMADGIHPQKRP